jgi:hypothetical protein
MPVSDYTPTIDDVGALLRARTKDSDGEEIGTFTPTTRPTDTEVETLIGQAAGYMSLFVGDDTPQALWEEIGDVVSIRAAMTIELSYYPEQVASDRSAYAQYKLLWDEAVGTDPEHPGWLVLACRRAEDSGIVEIDQPGMPKYGFPKVGPGVAKPVKPLIW